MVSLLEPACKNMVAEPAKASVLEVCHVRIDHADARLPHLRQHILVPSPKLQVSVHRPAAYYYSYSYYSSSNGPDVDCQGQPKIGTTGRMKQG